MASYIMKMMTLQTEDDHADADTDYNDHAGLTPTKSQHAQLKSAFRIKKRGFCIKQAWALPQQMWVLCGC